MSKVQLHRRFEIYEPWYDIGGWCHWRCAYSWFDIIIHLFQNKVRCNYIRYKIIRLHKEIITKTTSLKKRISSWF